mmetsp:Transcript_22847/g.49854  ORF Transcript_22847/g.49854 Transcript_22847/m.49854 type:complete len:255 (+) Transcript_22847:214-978(+)
MRKLKGAPNVHSNSITGVRTLEKEDNGARTTSVAVHIVFKMAFVTARYFPGVDVDFVSCPIHLSWCHSRSDIWWHSRRILGRGMFCKNRHGNFCTFRILEIYGLGLKHVEMTRLRRRLVFRELALCNVDAVLPKDGLVVNRHHQRLDTIDWDAHVLNVHLKSFVEGATVKRACDIFWLGAKARNNIVQASDRLSNTVSKVHHSHLTFVCISSSDANNSQLRSTVINIVEQWFQLPVLFAGINIGGELLCISTNH